VHLTPVSGSCDYDVRVWKGIQTTSKLHLSSVYSRILYTIVFVYTCNESVYVTEFPKYSDVYVTRQAAQHAVKFCTVVMCKTFHSIHSPTNRFVFGSMVILKMWYSIYFFVLLIDHSVVVT
jgi:hypothetical protein